MKPPYRQFHTFFAALGLMALLPGCHDKSLTAELQDEADKTSEALRRQTVELDNLNKACNTLGGQLRDFGGKKDEMAAEAARSAGTRTLLTDYRVALEKDLATLTDTLAKYRREQLKN